MRLTTWQKLKWGRAIPIVAPILIGTVAALSAGSDPEYSRIVIAGAVIMFILVAMWATVRCPRCGHYVMKRNGYWDGTRLPRKCPRCGESLKWARRRNTVVIHGLTALTYLHGPGRSHAGV
jgi:endogenous inhibitor of DNA gyrase (YacG/DUF329 family)